MTELLLHKRKVESVFHLLGEHENDITYSVAWALSQSPHFLSIFVHFALGVTTDSDSVVIRLQQHEKQAGITDIEIESPGKFFLIVEAKRGWSLPSRKQLETYAQRPSFCASKGLPRLILVMSECSSEFAPLNLETQKIAGVEIHPISWKQIACLAVEAQSNCSHAERRILRELLTYLRGLMTMQNLDSNWVYVLSLGSGTPDGWKISNKFFRAARGHAIHVRPKRETNFKSGKTASYEHIADAPHGNKWCNDIRGKRDVFLVGSKVSWVAAENGPKVTRELIELLQKGINWGRATVKNPLTQNARGKHAVLTGADAQRVTDWVPRVSHPVRHSDPAIRSVCVRSGSCDKD